MFIAAKADIGNNVILQQGASEAYRRTEWEDVLGQKHIIEEPYPTVYEDYQINCYAGYDVNDTSSPIVNTNVLTLEEVNSVCEWIKEQNEKNNFPNVDEKIISMECNPFVPQIRYVDEITNTIGYYITVRIRYVNDAQEKRVVVNAS